MKEIEIGFKEKKRVLEVKEIHFSEKDVIEFNKWEDFQTIAHDFNSIFLLNKTYYLISADVIYTYTPK